MELLRNKVIFLILLKAKARILGTKNDRQRRPTYSRKNCLRLRFMICHDNRLFDESQPMNPEFGVSRRGFGINIDLNYKFNYPKELRQDRLSLPEHASGILGQLSTQL